MLVRTPQVPVSSSLIHGNILKGAFDDRAIEHIPVVVVQCRYVNGETHRSTHPQRRAGSHVGRIERGWFSGAASRNECCTEMRVCSWRAPRPRQYLGFDSIATSASILKEFFGKRFRLWLGEIPADRTPAGCGKLRRHDTPVLADYDAIAISINLNRTTDSTGRHRVLVVVEARHCTAASTACKPVFLLVNPQWAGAPDGEVMPENA